MLARSSARCASQPLVQRKECQSERDVRVSCISRRQAAKAALLGAAACLPWPAAAEQHSLAVTSAQRLSPAAAATQVASNVSSSNSSVTEACDSLDPKLAAAFVQAVYDTVQQQQVMPEQQLQLERFKLQAQEFKYYAAANKGRMPVLPDLSDNSGGLSNRVFYNFISYVLWKVVARHLPSPEARTTFCEAVGQQLLQQLAPDALRRVRAAAAAGGRAPTAEVTAAMQQLLQLLQQGGYLCGWQLVLGSQPGSWPADWASSQGGLVDEEGLLGGEGEPLPAVFQVKLKLPADIEGSVALRAEENGFWSRHVSSMLLELLRAGNYGASSVDEYVYQDDWQGPASAAGKLLLLFGDPLQQVDVPFTPTTIVQDWSTA